MAALRQDHGLPHGALEALGRLVALRHLVSLGGRLLLVARGSLLVAVLVALIGGAHPTYGG